VRRVKSLRDHAVPDNQQETNIGFWKVDKLDKPSTRSRSKR